MTEVQIRSFVRATDGSFRDIAEIFEYADDCMYVSGAISLTIDGVEVFGLDLWDDVNWLWPLLVQALSECRRTGTGKRGFPDQPISIMAERVRSGHTLIRVTDGAKINRSAVASDDELFGAMAVAGGKFFSQLRRLCPDDLMGQQEEEILKAWSSAGGHHRSSSAVNGDGEE